ncbi:hypothetical protein [Jiella sonneratiae]|uniref:Uncharacterized protein n=1 Tax=Jiella sonneratiae TaxID=2816856 RepID=A0ABS3J1N7_9HYPH|nr:hypothetical protein [Jiella sonneratiae]MBO0903576.1 hypothetical protein [Jiella sonneratiae]
MRFIVSFLRDLTFDLYVFAAFVSAFVAFNFLADAGYGGGIKLAGAAAILAGWLCVYVVLRRR